LEKAVKKAKELNTDIIGFGDLIHKFHPKVWQEMIKDYDTLFPELDVEVQPKIIVTRILP
jgi:spore germination protein KC